MTAVDEAERNAYERELRVLLDRAVPRLAAPAERMPQIRERVRRRARRRRAAGAAGGVVVLAALATLVAPRFGAGGPAPGDPGPPVDPVPPAASGTAGRQAGAEVRYPRLGGLTVRLPAGWTALETTTTSASPGAEALGFAGNRPREAYGRPCQESPAGDCVPLDLLSPGDALVAFRPLTDKTPRGEAGPGALTKRALSSACAQAGATWEAEGRLAVPERRGGGAVRVSVCLTRPGAEDIRRIRDLYASARFGDDAPVAPGAVR
ncbi:hypothetical protein LRS74_17040 [Streptomyces sp. LX-29]|uniref:hypothetical protein n=1 Tax=Streptomyces sp. LX-29 TaxID=2900152 RepID=UPI00240E79E6|nr:hypothetical protein [Streptomyces sp. LX-29]WFB08563.1 hypothetical protein LRS74_17040 [Streptomyces sp. LX-29]